MSINRCPYCDKHIDEDFDLEHYEACKAEHQEKETFYIPATEAQKKKLYWTARNDFREDKELYNLINTKDLSKLSKVNMSTLITWLMTANYTSGNVVKAKKRLLTLPNRKGGEQNDKRLEDHQRNTIIW